MSRRPCLCTKKNPVGIELFSQAKNFFYSKQLKSAADHVTENDLLISANFIRCSSSVHLNGQTLELHPQACTVVLFIII